MMEQLAPVNSIYNEHKEHLDIFWEKICQEVIRRKLSKEDCWDFNVGSMEHNEDNYWRYRWQTETGEKRQRVVGKNKDGSQRTSICKVYTNHAIFVTHLAYLKKQGPVYSTRRHKRRDKTIALRYDISHLCSKRTCFNASHLTQEPHNVNMSRQKCFQEICLHSPKCIQTKDDVSKQLQEFISSLANDNGELM